MRCPVFDPPDPKDLVSFAVCDHARDRIRISKKTYLPTSV